jgi:hypothetical protein
MQKLYIFLLVFCQMCFLKIADVGADFSLEEEVTAMKSQMSVMQGKIDVLERKVYSQEDKIIEQQTQKHAYERRIQELESQSTQQPQAPVAPSMPSRVPGTKWIPDIGAVADVVLTVDHAKTDDEGGNRISLRELELVLGSNVDPYSRLDATVSFSDSEEPSLEEAYLTRFGLPLETTARIGKFLPKVGKVLGVHRDSLDTVDEPLVITKFFGAEGMSKSGFDLTKMVNIPWPITHQLTFGVLEGGNGEDGTAFGTARKRPTLYAHLKNYFDMSDRTGLEVGFSPMFGSKDEGANLDVRVLGVDATLVHHLSANQDLKFQAEAFNLDRKKTIDDEGNSLGGNFWGTYGLVDFRFHPQWATGFRYDYVEPVDNPADNPKSMDMGYTGYLAFHQSEFARWRLQYTHTDLSTGKGDDTVYLQGTFAIGEHKHKLQ